MLFTEINTKKKVLICFTGVVCCQGASRREGSLNLEGSWGAFLAERVASCLPAPGQGVGPWRMPCPRPQLRLQQRQQLPVAAVAGGGAVACDEPVAPG